MGTVTVASTNRPATGPATGPAFVLLGTVQSTLIFTLASLSVPLPRIGREFALGRADLILLSAAYGLTFAGLLLFGGRLSDRYGGRRLLTAGLLVLAVASAVAPFAPGYETLLAARFAQGMGAALVAPAAMAVLRELFPAPAAYGKAMAIWGGLSMLGATAGTLGSGVISQLASWRWSFAVPLVVTIAALTLAPRLLPPTPPPPPAPPRTRPALDLPGAVLATAGITLASYGLVLTDAHPWGSAAVLVPLLTGIALLAAFVVVENRARDPLLPPRFLLDRRRALGLLAIVLTAAASATTFVLLSLHLQEERGFSAIQTSAAYVPFAVALIGSGRAAGALIGRYGPQAVTAGGLGTGAAGLALLAATGLDTHLPYAYGLLPGLLLLPAGAAASFAGAAVLATDGVPPERIGLAGGVLNTAMEFGPTVVFAALLTLGNDASSFAATATAFALVSVLASVPSLKK